MDFLSHVKTVLCKSTETQEISGFAARLSRMGKTEEFTATESHLEMMSSIEEGASKKPKRKKGEGGKYIYIFYELMYHFPIFFSKIQVLWL